MPDIGEFLQSKDGSTEVSPEEFEREVLALLARDTRPINPELQHREKLHGPDGTYEVDITLRFTVGELAFLVLVECKHQRYAVKREVVQVLHDRVRSLGAHKGVLATTAHFQTGAVAYAKAHGIALLRIVNKAALYETRGRFPVAPPPWAKLRGYALQLVEESEGGIQFHVLDEDSGLFGGLLLGAEPPPGE